MIHKPLPIYIIILLCCIFIHFSFFIEIKLYKKMKEEKLQNDRMKKEEEDLIKMRLEQSEDLDNDVNLDEHKISLENRENLSLRKIMDNIKLEGLNNDIDEEGSEKEDTYVTDSSINFETLNNRDLENLKKKYKVMSKSNRVFEEDLRRLKFYICKRLNKKKHIFKSAVKDVKAKEKKKRKNKENYTSFKTSWIFFVSKNTRRFEKIE